MDCFFWEHFQCAVRDLILFGGVDLVSVILCLLWHYDLYMTLWTQCPALKQGF